VFLPFPISALMGDVSDPGLPVAFLPMKSDIFAQQFRFGTEQLVITKAKYILVIDYYLLSTVPQLMLSHQTNLL